MYKVWDSYAQSHWTFRKVQGDVFSAPEDFALAHCVAVDMQMGAGIAVEFKRRFGGVPELRRPNPQIGGMASLKRDNRIIYYLTTKQLSKQKPNYSDLLSSLYAMKVHMHENGIRKLAIPKIGCGLDGLEWKEVFNLLQRVFFREPVEIVLYCYPPVRRVLFP